MEPSSQWSTVRGTIAHLRRLALVELPFSLALYIAARLLSGHASSPSSPLYIMLIVLILMTGVLSSTLSLLAAIITIEHWSTTILALSSALLTIGGSAAAAIAFSPTTATLRAAMLAAAVATVYMLVYNMAKVFELMAERKPGARYEYYRRLAWWSRRGR